MESKKITLLFLCSRLGGGGAEKHLQRILNNADFSQYDIHLALTREGGSYEKELSPEINIHHLTKSQKSSTLALLQSTVSLQKLIKKLQPSAVISFMDRQNMLSGFVKTFVPLQYKMIFCVQNAPSKSLANDGYFGRLLSKWLPRVYNQADLIIAICKGVARDLSSTFKVTAPLEVIYNAGYDEVAEERMRADLPSQIYPLEGKQLVAVGRLTKQKGFDVLLEALALITSPFKLWLLGRGEDEEKLKKKCADLGLSDKVNFLGFQENPYPFYRVADVFVLSSRWEGFGNVITEAMVCETAVVATRCPFGPDEIITSGVNGLLTNVENPEDLAKSISRLLLDVELREKIAANGKERSVDFTAAKISTSYFETIRNVISG